MVLAQAPSWAGVCCDNAVRIRVDSECHRDRYHDCSLHFSAHTRQSTQQTASSNRGCGLTKGNESQAARDAPWRLMGGAVRGLELSWQIGSFMNFECLPWSPCTAYCSPRPVKLLSGLRLLDAGCYQPGSVRSPTGVLTMGQVVCAELPC
jgi:hypothetical protein